MDLTGKSFVVTGVARGMGRAVAEAVCRAGGPGTLAGLGPEILIFGREVQIHAGSLADRGPRR